MSIIASYSEASLSDFGLCHCLTFGRSLNSTEPQFPPEQKHCIFIGTLMELIYSEKAEPVCMPLATNIKQALDANVLYENTLFWCGEFPLKRGLFNPSLTLQMIKSSPPPRKVKVLPRERRTAK